MVEANKKLLQPLLIDASFILQRNCKLLTSKKYSVEPFYTDSDVYITLNKTKTYCKDEIHKLNEYVSFRFVNNGHILGATSIELFFKTPSGQIKKLYYSGDISSSYNKQPFCTDNDFVIKSNVAIFEATYSDMSRNFTKKDVKIEREKMKQDIKNEIKNKRSILFAAFAMSRTQNLMVYLYENFKDDPDFKNIPIYVDGKLSLIMNNTYLDILEGEEKEYWKEVMGWSNFHYINSYEESVCVATRKDEISITISSAGMMNVGRILSHLKYNLENPKYTVMVIGYCSPSTIGGQLLDSNSKSVKIEGLEHNIRCKILRYKTWSSHMQGQELINYMSQISSNLIIIHHSDESKYNFRDIAEEQLRQKNNSAKIVCASNENNIFYI